MASRSNLLAALAMLGLASAALAAAPEVRTPVGHDEALRWAESTLSGLTLERKVAQMVCEQMRGDYAATDSGAFTDTARLVREHGVGCFVVYGGTPHGTAVLLNRLQELSELPLLVSADFEGGPGQQFEGATEFPANMALAAIGSEDLAYQVGKAGAVEGRAIGVHLTYSPVVDVQTRPENPVLSVRSFGRDLDRLGRMAGAYIRGYQENGMLATAKHYPGRGDVDLYGETEFLINPKSEERFEAEDLRAFGSAIDAGVAYVMSEHIAVPAATYGSPFPASVEGELATVWLRDRLGFEGVLTTDDLWYPKVVERFGAERAGVLAIQAGHDALLKPANAVAMIAAVAAAVRAGEIEEARIDDSVRKLLYWKARLNLHRERTVDVEAIADVVGSEAHRDLLREVADRSLTVVRGRDVIAAARRFRSSVLHVSIQRDEHDAAPVEAARRLESALGVTETFFFRPGSDSSRRQQAVEAARRASVVVVSVFRQRDVYRNNGPLRSEDRELVEDLVALQPKTIVVSYGNPYVAGSIPEQAAFVVGYGERGFYGNQLVYVDSFVRLLEGTIEGEGTLPVALR